MVPMLNSQLNYLEIYHTILYNPVQHHITAKDKNMWKLVKYAQPLVGSTIEIVRKGKILKCFVADTTVYNSKNNLIVKTNEIELWRHHEEEAAKS